jgi:phage gp16-like protein
MHGRNAKLAKIHILKKELAMEEDIYRQLIFEIGNVLSSAYLDARGLSRLIDRLEYLKSGQREPGNYRSYPGKPANIRDGDRSAMLKKIEALLADAARPWQYVHAMAQHMFRIERVNWCRPGELHKIIAALEYDKRRRQRRAI